MQLKMPLVLTAILVMANATNAGQTSVKYCGSLGDFVALTAKAHQQGVPDSTLHEWAKDYEDANGPTKVSLFLQFWVVAVSDQKIHSNTEKRELAIEEMRLKSTFQCLETQW